MMPAVPGSSLGHQDSSWLDAAWHTWTQNLPYDLKTHETGASPLRPMRQAPQKPTPEEIYDWNLPWINFDWKTVEWPSVETEEKHITESGEAAAISGGEKGHYSLSNMD